MFDRVSEHQVFLTTAISDFVCVRHHSSLMEKAPPKWGYSRLCSSGYTRLLCRLELVAPYPLLRQTHIFVYRNVVLHESSRYLVTSFTSPFRVLYLVSAVMLLLLHPPGGITLSGISNHHAPGVTTGTIKPELNTWFEIMVKATAGFSSRAMPI